MWLDSRRSRRQRNPQAGVIAAIVVAAAAVNGLVTSGTARGKHLRGGDIGSPTTLLIFGAAIALPIVVFLIMKITRSGDDGESHDDDTGSAPSSDAATGEDNDPRPRMLLVALVAALIGIAVGMFAWTRQGHV